MKEQIRAASIQLFAEKGFKETSIQDIVNALSVTKGTFYYYFTSKEQLLMDIHLSYIDSLLLKQKTILDDPLKNYREKLYDVVYLLIHDIEKEGLSAKVYFREMRNLSEPHLSLIASKRNQFRKQIEEIISKGMDHQEFRDDLPVDIVTLGVLGMANWSYFWFDPSGRETDSNVSEIFLKILLEGLKGSN
ncbi:TetR/AcrR family transcriptional regulator [Bacillus sp. FJAT-42376]|uniref:TetR/AcrR family transcriptional regulator n=1 Tax=Bacillus sp. FJAT-42376 TaxID=2014076 RepID=UPI000F4D7DE1|nr:TetR/AcrR family transcriptional regulator [Bacillus sp. FJAT-42376]AZB44011.1 TetR/AcrR family transcriptional regulator [Bacillus sp. FJAT-42376]